jgi:MinD-like ATPase involved in chromosome partitioning or flagellar assembly
VDCAISPLRAERSTLSEHDWQATVLAELGVPRFGLVTPDGSGPSTPPGGFPSTRTAPAPAPIVEQPVEQEQPGSGEQWPAQSPVPTQWDPPEDRPPAERTQYDAPEPWHASAEDGSPVPDESPAVEPMAPPSDGSLGAWQPMPPPAPEGPPPAGNTVPPSAKVHSAPVPPEFRSEPQPSWPQAAEQEQAPDPAAAAWELASQNSWGLVAQEPWGTERTQLEPEAPFQQQPWERSEPEAWQRGSEPPRPQPPPQQAPPYRAAPPQQGPSPHDLVRRTAHGDPLVRRMSRGVRRAVGAGASDEVRRTADVEQTLSRPVPSCRQIAVTSIRGGAGKTTVAGLTATVIAQYRQDRVLAIDADSGLGSLPLRLGVRTDRSLHDLAASRPRGFDEAARFLGRTADGLWVLSGTAGGRITHELDLGTFRTAAGTMSRYFSAFVVDCGAGLLPELQRGILSDAHAQVMVTPGTVDGALSARGALEWQARNGYQHLLTRTVVAFVTHTPHVDADLTRGAQLLSGGGMPVVHMPYDRHLATGTAVESARIGQETRAAAIRVALEAFARATSV